ncbi:hypothetical protein LOY37_09955 [Pseudomonas sp. B21-012]|uniref:hypothetical protein n=1 Tax=unclassified Pseudomonas TaxID=196821 RepID=UPI001BCD75B9|nr:MULTISPECIES: hypothetical protein [unclassified Pseudomonas]QVM94909.1 hypothetical protein JYG36_17490 [Pseudomonas sp. SORT22]UVM57870.1 hypothetical protein LOY37_09955 [Pseudomonas sp. B21-012]
MTNPSKKPFILAGAPLIAMGSGFIAVGLSGQPAFAYTGLGLLIPGIVLVAIEFYSRRRRA